MNSTSIDAIFMHILGRTSTTAELDKCIDLSKKGNLTERNLKRCLLNYDEYKTKPLINVFMLCRNNSSTISRTLNGLDEIESKYKQYRFHYYF